jgi:hypothetical protein
MAVIKTPKSRTAVGIRVFLSRAPAEARKSESRPLSISDAEEKHTQNSGSRTRFVQSIRPASSGMEPDEA